MNETERSEAAHRFGQAADALVDACRRLEQCGVADQPIERLLHALEDVTHQVHRLHPPDERVKFETADLASVACHVAAREASAKAEADGARTDETNAGSTEGTVGAEAAHLCH